MNNETAFARELLSRANTFDPRSYRTIVGIASTSRPCSGGGKRLLSSGASATLPIPLLLNHNWTCPLGLVTKIKCVGDALWFEARHVNIGWHWASATWNDIAIERRLYGASVHAEPTCEPSLQEWTRWKLFEISLVEHGEQDNSDCLVTRITERIDRGPRPVNLRGKSSPRYQEIIHRPGRTIPGEEKTQPVVRLDVVRTPSPVVSLPTIKRAERSESPARREPGYLTRDMSLISKRGRF